MITVFYDCVKNLLCVFCVGLYQLLWQKSPYKKKLCSK